MSHLLQSPSLSLPSSPSSPPSSAESAVTASDDNATLLSWPSRLSSSSSSLALLRTLAAASSCASLSSSEDAAHLSSSSSSSSSLSVAPPKNKKKRSRVPLDQDSKRERRKQQNREAAATSRRKKKMKVDELEAHITQLLLKQEALLGSVKSLEEENAKLKQTAMISSASTSSLSSLLVGGEESCPSSPVLKSSFSPPSSPAVKSSLSPPSSPSSSVSSCSSRPAKMDPSLMNDTIDEEDGEDECTHSLSSSLSLASELEHDSIPNSKASLSSFGSDYFSSLHSPSLVAREQEANPLPFAYSAAQREPSSSFTMNPCCVDQKFSHGLAPAACPLKREPSELNQSNQRILSSKMTTISKTLPFLLLLHSTATQATCLCVCLTMISLHSFLMNPPPSSLPSTMTLTTSASDHLVPLDKTTFSNSPSSSIKQEFSNS